MRRITEQHVDAILTDDFHLREDTPVCRTDDFQAAQWAKLDFISTLQVKYNCPVLHAGDLFDFWKPSPRLLSLAIKHLPWQFYTVYGQHDLPQHSLELADKSGIYTLQTAERLKVVGASWGMRPEDAEDFIIADRKILLWHVPTWKGENPYKTDAVSGAAALLRKYPQFDLIVTGDNHQTFIEEYQGRLLVNAGSISRQEAGQINHHPAVYLWCAEENTVSTVYLPAAQGVISRAHIDKIEERDERIDSFIRSLNKDYAAGVSFEANLSIFERQNNVRSSVMEIVHRSIETIKK